MGAERDQILKLTDLLRADSDPLWSRLRVLLREKGVEPGTSILADCFPDDVEFEFGIIVTVDGHVFQFGFEYLNRPVEQGTLSEWVDLTARHNVTPYHAEIAEALELRSTV